MFRKICHTWCFPSFILSPTPPPSQSVHLFNFPSSMHNPTPISPPLVSEDSQPFQTSPLTAPTTLPHSLKSLPALIGTSLGHNHPPPRSPKLSASPFPSAKSLPYSDNGSPLNSGRNNQPSSLSLVRTPLPAIYPPWHLTICITVCLILRRQQLTLHKRMVRSFPKFFRMFLPLTKDLVWFLPPVRKNHSKMTLIFQRILLTVTWFCWMKFSPYRIQTFPLQMLLPSPFLLQPTISLFRIP